MASLALIVQVASLVSAAYVIGAAAGYGLHRLLVALRTPRPLAVPRELPAVALVQRRPRPTPAARLAMAATPEEIAPPAPIVAAAPSPRSPAKPRDPKPKSLPAPRGGVADDLRQIKGIGPKIETILNDLGVFHYDQIAAWTRSNMEWMDLKLGFKGRVARENWVAQARSLAKPPTAKPARKVA